MVRERSRAGIFAAAIALTVLIGAAGIGLFPHFQDSPSSASQSASTAFERAAIATIVAVPVKNAVSKTSAVATKSAVLPADSGTGRRVVFSQSDQRVWLVEANGAIANTYLVSGSTHDNLNPGTYAVQLHQMDATAYDYKSHMNYFVQFTRGKNAVIGFHDIPVSNSGQLLQTAAQLGTPLSSGCIRQNRPDAIKLWNFAPVGTKVVVTV